MIFSVVINLFALLHGNALKRNNRLKRRIMHDMIQKNTTEFIKHYNYCYSTHKYNKIILYCVRRSLNVLLSVLELSDNSKLNEMLDCLDLKHTGRSIISENTYRYIKFVITVRKDIYDIINSIPERHLLNSHNFFKDRLSHSDRGLAELHSYILGSNNAYRSIISDESQCPTDSNKIQCPTDLNKLQCPTSSRETHPLTDSNKLQCPTDSNESHPLTDQNFLFYKKIIENLNVVIYETIKLIKSRKYKIKDVSTSLSGQEKAALELNQYMDRFSTKNIFVILESKLFDNVAMSANEDDLYYYNFASNFAPSKPKKNQKNCAFNLFRQKVLEFQERPKILTFVQTDLLFYILKAFTEINKTCVILKVRKHDDKSYLVSCIIQTKEDYFTEMLKYYKAKLNDTRSMKKEIAKRIAECGHHSFSTIVNMTTYTFKDNGTTPKLAKILMGECGHFAGLELLEEIYIFNQQKCHLCRTRFVVKKYFEAEVYKEQENISTFKTSSL